MTFGSLAILQHAVNYGQQSSWGALQHPRLGEGGSEGEIGRGRVATWERRDVNILTYVNAALESDVEQDILRSVCLT